ncbi:hypothetical protein OH805_02570 [Streptomyces sp. NBC_00879]|uniref:hypothetical protein n=1 Tax=Streptomyces sp. NBC_00879 TaxID=2975855 RepID=UPI0038633E2A|nr:hypothetical protein OH805_02570 [Streptomyces sp. NBC_00879]
MAGAAVGALTGGVGWALAVGGTAAVAGAQVGRARPDSTTRRHAKLTRATAEHVAPLRREGWRLLHARPIGQDPDRVYHLCVPPSANTVMVLMDWSWPQGAQVSLDEQGALHAGAQVGDVAVDWVLHAGQHVRDALDGSRKALGRIGVGQALPVHGAAVANDGHLQFRREHAGEDREINVLSAAVMLEKMRTVPGDSSRSTRRAARHFAEFLDNTFP